MALTNAFHEAVSAGNLQRVRIMMKDSLLLDPTFREFKEMEAEAKSIPGLYEPHDGRAFKQDKGEWDDDYMNELRVQVISNFSHERIQHLQDVIRYLRPTPEPAHQTSSGSEPRRNVTYTEQKRRDQESGAYIGAKVATGAVVGAATGGAIAAVASVTTAGIAGAAIAGAVVGGTAVYVVSKEH